MFRIPNNGANLIPTMTREQVRVMYRDILGIDPDEITLPGQEGSGIPPLRPNKMLINLVKLLARIYAGYGSKEIMEETKRLLDTLYQSRIITNTVYNI